MNQPATCYCGCDFNVHRDGATHCTTCTTCPGYAERAEVLLTLDTLNTDDWLADDHGLRDNHAAALDIARRRWADREAS